MVGLVLPSGAVNSPMPCREQEVSSIFWMKAYINKWNYTFIIERIIFAMLQTNDVFEHATTNKERVSLRINVFYL